MKHPHHDILIAIAEGKEIQYFDKTQPDFQWTPCQPNLFFANMNAFRREYEYRIKPATITINGVECEKNVMGVDAHFCLVVANGESGGVGIKNIWFATKEARDAAYAALIKPFGEQA